jgi:PhzF family phenazine biosynthesis protein
VILPFHQVDAFAAAPLTGNPAAVMLLPHWLDDDLLQRIAAENNVSETAFLVPLRDGEADHELRWFTPTVEVALCGHATLASGHVLLAAPGAPDRLRFRTRRSGVLTVTREGDGYALALPALPAAPRPLPAIVAALGLAAEDVDQTLWHPGRYGLVVLREAAAVRALVPDFARLAQEGDVLTIVTAPGDGETDVVSRVFAPGAGIDEDPVTGSAHAVLTPYWAERLGRDAFSAWQASARGGAVGCRHVAAAGDRAAQVVLSGRCVDVIEGRFRLA